MDSVLQFSEALSHPSFPFSSRVRSAQPPYGILRRAEWHVSKVTRCCESIAFDEAKLTLEQDHIRVWN